MTTLSRIRAKIIEAVPEIQSFCSACDADGTHCSSCGGDGLDAPRPITLDDQEPKVHDFIAKVLGV